MRREPPVPALNVQDEEHFYVEDNRTFDGIRVAI